MIFLSIESEFLHLTKMGLAALPGQSNEDKIEFLANILGIAGFVMSLGLLGVGVLYRRGTRRAATHGDIERLGATVVETLSDRLIDRLARPEIERIAASSQLNDEQRTSSAAQIRSSLTSTLQVLTDSDTAIANAAATALLHGDTKPAEEFFADRAARALEEGNGLNDAAARALHHKAALEALRDPEVALASCRNAMRLQPDDAIGWSQLANIHLRLGQLDEARVAFDKALGGGSAAHGSITLIQ